MGLGVGGGGEKSKNFVDIITLVDRLPVTIGCGYGNKRGGGDRDSFKVFGDKGEEAVN